ncbi:hypothetical protein [uncultured Nostoc sp.]|uniref:hypothetical protein n=1 Tax=uncultured Nostoc sp. TaxID=340711 RepID=UPI0035CA575F
MPSLLLSETLREREACLRYATLTPTATSSLRDATRSLLPRSGTTNAQNYFYRLDSLF